jgi:predicted transcriptional regulator YdeE
VTCKATIVDLPDLRLMVTRADEFPSGIRAAWDRLESRLSSLKGRKFYGVVLCEESQMVYYAGVEPASEEEVSLLGLATMIVKGGKYARAKLLDWPNHTNKIGEIFAELMRDFGVDPKGPTVE